MTIHRIPDAGSDVTPCCSTKPTDLPPEDLFVHDESFEKPNCPKDTP